MDNNRFFKFLWRANALFLFGAGLILVGMLLMAAFFMISDLGSSDTPPPIASAKAQPTRIEEVFQLVPPSRQYGREDVEGFSYFQLRATSNSSGKLGSGKRGNGQLRNIGVFDLNTDKTHWIFPDAQQEIEGFRSVKRTLTGENLKAKEVTTGFLFTVAKSLPDGTVTRDLLVMRPDGKSIKKLLSDISGNPDIQTYGENKIKLIVETDSDFDIYPFDIDALTIGTPTRISIP